MKDLTDITVEEQKINEYLEDTDLSCADLSCADLRDANLQGTDLQGTDLRSADLRCANLKGIKITKQQLEQLTVIEEDE
ncbi:pentapeptide repeat-containing protein [Spiroplasma citri]|nr:pentapeptide repeat-containing protein [Spiroplasma citri]